MSILLITKINGSPFAFNNALKQMKCNSSDEIYALGNIAGKNEFIFTLLRDLITRHNFHPIMGKNDAMFLVWLLSKRYPESPCSKYLESSNSLNSWETAYDISKISTQELDIYISWINSWPCAINLSNAYLLSSISDFILSEDDLIELAKLHHEDIRESYRKCKIYSPFSDPLIESLQSPTYQFLFDTSKEIYVGDSSNLDPSLMKNPTIICLGRDYHDGLSIMNLDTKEQINGILETEAKWA